MRRLSLLLLALTFSLSIVLATNNYEYGPNEYVTISSGASPDGHYAVTAHGEGEYGYDHFHIFLTNAETGKRIGPLEEITDVLDTGAGSYCARWSTDSSHVTIIYRVDRHAPLKEVSYRIANNRAYPLEGPVDADDTDTKYWQDACSGDHPAGRAFGTPVQK